MSLLSTDRLSVRIGDIKVCRDLDIEVDAGDIIAIVGANGTGKTTLLHTLAGLREPSHGAVHLQDQPIQNLSGRQRALVLGILFQNIADPLYSNVLETVLTGRHPHLPPLSNETDEDRLIAREALRATGIVEKAHLPVSVLSGGEKTRVALAALLTQQPRICLLDEPNAHLDLHYQIRLLDLMVDYLHEHNGCAVWVLHDVNLAIRYCHKALLLFGNGETCFGDADTVLTTEQLTRLYGQRMLEIRDGKRRCFIPA
ncbi:MAG: ABC transporter ATP-binding protein [marine bacterium B5-7]|nr:MAG: ABC transporter ATP-binding protein [marine bacterium B5-7]